MRRITYIVLAVLFVVLVNTSLFAQGASRTFGAGRLQLDDGANNFVYMTTKTGTLGIDNTGAVIPGVQTFPSNCALLDLSSVTKGFLPPRMLTAQEMNICGGTPNEGLVVYNLSTHTLDVYNGSGWAPVGGGWSLFGNSLTVGGGTGAGQNYIGTNNATDFVIATNVGAPGSGVGERIRVTSTGNVNIAGINGVSNITASSLGGAPLLAPPLNLPTDGLIIGKNAGDLYKYDVATVVGAVAWLRTGNTILDVNNKLGTINDVAINIVTNDATRVTIGNSAAANAVTVTGNALINGNAAVTGTFTSAGNSTVGTNGATTNSFGNTGASVNAIGNGIGAQNTVGNGGGATSNTIGTNAASNNFGNGATNNNFGNVAVMNQFGTGATTNNIGTSGTSTNTVLGTTNINTTGNSATSIGSTATGGAVTIATSNPNPLTLNVGATTNNLVLNNILQDNNAVNLLMLTGVNSGNTRTRAIGTLIAANEGLVLDLSNPALPTVKLGSSALDPVNAFLTNRTVSLGANLLNFNNNGNVTFASLNGANNAINLNNFSATANTNIGFDAVGNNVAIQGRTTNVGTLSAAQAINIGTGGGNTTIGLAPGSTNNINGTNNTMTATGTNLLTAPTNTINGTTQNNVTAPTNVITGNTLNNITSTTENRVSGPTNINTTTANTTTIGNGGAVASNTVVNVGTAGGNLTLNNIVNDNTITNILVQTGAAGSGNVRYRTLASLIAANQGLILDNSTPTPTVRLGSAAGDPVNPFLVNRTVSLGGQSLFINDGNSGTQLAQFNGAGDVINLNTLTTGTTTIGSSTATATNINGPTNINNAVNSNTQINTGGSSGTVTIGNAAAGTVQLTSGTAVNANSPNNTLTATTTNLLTAPTNTLTGATTNNVNAPTNNMGATLLNNINSATENRLTGPTNINTTANNLTTIGQNAGTASTTVINVGTAGGNLTLNNIVRDNFSISLLTTTGIGSPASGNVRYRQLATLIAADQGLILDNSTATPTVRLGSAGGDPVNPFAANRTVSLANNQLIFNDNAAVGFVTLNGNTDAVNINTTTAGTTTIGSSTATATNINGPTNINNAVNSNTQINTGGSSGSVTVGTTSAGTVALTSGTAVNVNILGPSATNINTGTATGDVNLGNTGLGPNINMSVNAARNITMQNIQTDIAPTQWLTLNAANQVKVTSLANIAEQGVSYQLEASGTRFRLGGITSTQVPFTVNDRFINMDARNLFFTRNGGANNVMQLTGGATGGVDITAPTNINTANNLNTAIGTVAGAGGSTTINGRPLNLNNGGGANGVTNIGNTVGGITVTGRSTYSASSPINLTGTDGTSNQVMRSNGLGATPSWFTLTTDATLLGDGVGTSFGIDLNHSNTWNVSQTFGDNVGIDNFTVNTGVGGGTATINLQGGGNLVLNNIANDNTTTNILTISGAGSGNVRYRTLASLINADQGTQLVTIAGVPTVLLGGATNVINPLTSTRFVNLTNQVLNFTNAAGANNLVQLDGNAGSVAVNGTLTSTGNTTLATNAATTNTFGNNAATSNSIGTSAVTNNFGNSAVASTTTNNIGNSNAAGGTTINNIGRPVAGGFSTTNIGDIAGAGSAINVLGVTSINTTFAATTTIGNTGAGGNVTIASANTIALNGTTNINTGAYKLTSVGDGATANQQLRVNGVADAIVGNTLGANPTVWDLVVTGDQVTTGIAKFGGSLWIDGVSATHQINANAPLNIVTTGGNLGLTASGSINFNSNIGTSIVPSVNNSFDLGSAANRWNNLFVTTINLPLGTYPSGSVLFANAAGQIAADNPSFFYSNTLKRLGIGNNAPTQALDVTGNGNFSGSLAVGTTVTAGSSVGAGSSVTAGTFMTAGTSIAAGTTITAGTGITSNSGNIVATAGQVNAGTSMTAGTTINAGGAITAGSTLAAGTSITAGTSIAAGTTLTAGTGLTVTSGGATINGFAASADAFLVTVPTAAGGDLHTRTVASLPFIGGSGTLNTIAMFTPNGTTIGNSPLTVSGGVNVAGSGSLTAGTSLAAGTTVAAGTSIGAGTFITAGTTIAAGTGITSASGNIVATAGQVNAGTSMTAGTTINAGGAITAGSTLAAGTTVTAGTSISAGTTITAGTGLTVTAGGANINGLAQNNALVDLVVAPSTTGGVLATRSVASLGFITGAGTLNTIPMFTPTGTSLGNSPLTVVGVNVTGSGSLNAGTSVGAGTSVTAGTFITAGTTIAAGTGITSASGNIVATAGQVNAGTSVSAATTVAAGTSITAGTSIAAGTTLTAGTGLTVTAGGANINGLVQNNALVDLVVAPSTTGGALATRSVASLGILSGSGTLNTIAMFTPSGTQVGNSPLTVSGADVSGSGKLTAATSVNAGTTVNAATTVAAGTNITAVTTIAAGTAITAGTTVGAVTTVTGGTGVIATTGAINATGGTIQTNSVNRIDNNGVVHATGFTASYTAQGANYGALVTDYFIRSTAGGITITLPAATTGQIIVVKNSAAAAVSVTAATIDGAAPVANNLNAGVTRTYVFDGAGWWSY